MLQWYISTTSISTNAATAISTTPSSDVSSTAVNTKIEFKKTCVGFWTLHKNLSDWNQSDCNTQKEVSATARKIGGFIYY